MADTSTLGALLAHARNRLARAGIADAALDARVIVEHFTGTSRTDAVVDPGRVVDADAVRDVLEALERRVAGEPVHRILGFREFHGLTLKLSPGTLEPRPDTETLVDLVLPIVRRVCEREGACRILDLGTGTGAIALALLKEEPRASAVGCDISDDALATARRNADMTGNAARFTAVRSDWFGSIEGRFHIIVSNPPYIATQEIEKLGREVRIHDPLAALDGGPDGLAPYRIIAGGAAAHLTEGGTVAVEVGHDQAEAVEAIFAGAGFTRTGSARDLGGHLRALAFNP